MQDLGFLSPLSLSTCSSIFFSPPLLRFNLPCLLYILRSCGLFTDSLLYTPFSNSSFLAMALITLHNLASLILGEKNLDICMCLNSCIVCCLRLICFGNKKVFIFLGNLKFRLSSNNLFLVHNLVKHYLLWGMWRLFLLN